MDDNFKFVVPAEITKSKDGEWKVAGLASTASVDRQGEIILPQGIDATPIAKGQGSLNWEHSNDPENTIGALDAYKKTSDGMYVEGRLYKNHTRAKAVYEIMSSLNKGDRGRIGMSVEGKVLERDSTNPAIIKRCLIKNVALTFNAVNQDTYADLVKSMSSSVVEFNSTGNVSPETNINQVQKSDEPMFTSSQVVSIVEKALGVGAGNSIAPNDRTGGDALGTEDLNKKKKKVMKKSLDLFKANMIEMLDKLQVLYPNNSRTEIWEAVRDRLDTNFPELKKE